MGFFEMFEEKYPAKVNCLNCNKQITIGVPKGISLKEFISRGKAKCSNCGCRIEDETNNNNN